MTTADIQKIELVSTTLRKLVRAAGTRIGSDCYTHAALGQALLDRLGIASRLVAGYAAWRVGPGSGDVITHVKTPGAPPQAGALAYHAWLELAGDKILDFSTYQLPIKAVLLDAMDHGKTSVDWHPDFLLVSRSRAKSHREVAQAAGPGVFYYERDFDLETRLRNGFVLDQEDLANAWLILQNPDVTVFGPNDVPAGSRTKP